MSRVLFYERQKFDQPWFYILVFVANLSVLIPVFFGFYTQIILGKPWGNENPMSDIGLIIFVLSMSLLMMIINWLLFSCQLETEIKDRSFNYRFKPFVSSWKSIDKTDIEFYKVRKYKAIREFGGWGYRINLFRKVRAYSIKGNMGLQLKIKNKKEALFGTQKPVELQKAMEHLMEKKQP